MEAMWPWLNWSIVIVISLPTERLGVLKNSGKRVRSRSNWFLEALVFKERGKPEYTEKNLSKQGREPTTKSTHIWRRRQDSNPGQWWEASALITASPLLPNVVNDWKVLWNMLDP